MNDNVRSFAFGLMQALLSSEAEQPKKTKRIRRTKVPEKQLTLGDIHRQVRERQAEGKNAPAPTIEELDKQFASLLQQGEVPEGYFRPADKYGP